MISIYLASVDFHLTRLLCSKVSPYSANPLTRDKETETTSILLVNDPPKQLLVWVGEWGPTRAGQAPSEDRGSEGRGKSTGHLLWPQPSCGAGSWQPSLAPPESPALVPGTVRGLGLSPRAAAI